MSTTSSRVASATTRSSSSSQGAGRGFPGTLLGRTLGGVQPCCDPDAFQGIGQQVEVLRALEGVLWVTIGVPCGGLRFIGPYGRLSYCGLLQVIGADVAVPA